MKILDQTQARWQAQLEDYADLVTVRAAGEYEFVDDTGLIWVDPDSRCSRSRREAHRVAASHSVSTPATRTKGRTMTDQLARPDEHAWLQWRREGVTATDVADAYAGTYGGIYSVVARKRGLETVESTPEMQRGHDWQPVIADAVHVLTGMFVVGEETWCAHADDDRWRATVDGFLAPQPETSIDDVTAVVEIKTRGVRVRADWDRWVTQMQWQMFVTGLDRALLADATIDDDDNECRAVRLTWVDADPDHQTQLVELAETIHGHVQVGTSPDPDTPTALPTVKVVHGVADRDADVVDLTDITGVVERFAEIKAAVKAVTDERDLLEAQIREAVGDATRGTTDGFRVTVSAPSLVLTREAEAELLAAHPEFARPALDKDRVKAEAKDLYDSFRKPVGARRLTINPTKGDQP